MIGVLLGQHAHCITHTSPVGRATWLCTSNYTSGGYVTLPGPGSISPRTGGLLDTGIAIRALRLCKYKHAVVTSNICVGSHNPLSRLGCQVHQSPEPPTFDSDAVNPEVPSSLLPSLEYIDLSYALTGINARNLRDLCVSR